MSNTEYPPTTTITANTVGDNVATCQCGWKGRHRVLRATAIKDGIDHRTHTGHSLDIA